MFSFTRHPIFIAIVIAVIICVLSGGAAAGGHNVNHWAHQGVTFISSAFGH